MAAPHRGNRALVRLDREEVALDACQYDPLRPHGFHRGGHVASVAWMTRDLGRVAGRLGDVPGALHYFRESERALRRLDIDTSEVQVNRAEVLLQAGLYGEAEEVATKPRERSWNTAWNSIAPRLSSCEAKHSSGS